MNTSRLRQFTTIFACLALIAVLSACQQAPAVTPTAQTQTALLPPTMAAFLTQSAVTPTAGVPTASPTVIATSTVSLTWTPTALPAAQTGGGQPRPTAAPKASLLAPCSIGYATEVYLVVDGQRRHIVDWDTFVNLGYKSTDIKDCGASSSLPEGAPITALIKGSSDDIYYMQNGTRRHVPDMDTFNALGFQTSNITTLPDAVVSLWPLGEPLTSTTQVPISTIVKQISIGVYTITQYHPSQGMFDYQVISAPGQQDIMVSDVDSIGQLPASDITGDGQPDVLFLIRSVGSAHCCSGTIVYNLGSTATKVLDVQSAPYYGGTGRGDFKDLNGDGVYEFITGDPFTGIPCSAPTVTTILSYDRGQGRYVGAAPQFASYYSDQIAQLNASLEPGGVCEIYPLVETLLYIGKPDDAKAAFDRLYNGSDAAGDWAKMQAAIKQTRYYVGG